jgi:hypothetical protein
MDEPTDGLDPNQKHEARTLIRRMGENKAIIFSTHILEEVDAVWSPDGKALFYAANAKGPHDLFRKRLDGAHAADLVYEAPGLQKPTSVSRDGRYLLLNSEATERNVLLVLDLGTGRARPLREGAFSDGHGSLSPDGRWLLFESDETGRPEIYVTPFPGPGRTFPISTNGGRNPDWRGDGREIVHAALDGRVLAAPAVPGATRSGSARARSSSGRCRPARLPGVGHVEGRSALRDRSCRRPREAKNELRLIVNWPGALENRR